MKVSDKEVWIVETKGREDLDDPLKIERLRQWCEDINVVQAKVKYGWLYVKQEEYEKYKAKNFAELINAFGAEPLY